MDWVMRVLIGLVIMAGLIIFIIILSVWQQNATAAILPLGTQSSSMTEPDSCGRAAKLATRLQDDRQLYTDMVTTLQQLEASTDSRVSDAAERIRHRAALKHSQELIGVELEAVADLQTMIRQFQAQHCSSKQ